MPHNVTNAIARSSILFTKNAASLESMESRFRALFNSGYRQMKMANGTTTPTAKKIRNIQPNEDDPKEWTDGTEPPRFMNMP